MDIKDVRRTSFVNEPDFRRHGSHERPARFKTPQALLFLSNFRRLWLLLGMGRPRIRSQNALIPLALQSSFLMKSNIALLCLMLCSGGFGSSVAEASLFLSFDTSSPSPLVAGSSGTIDVLIASDAPDMLDFFQVDVTLTPVGLSPSGGLKFAATQSDAQLIDPDYVFFGNSLTQNTPPTDVGTVDGSGVLFSAFDATDDGSGPPPLPGMPNPLPLSTSLTYLLFRLDLVAFAAGTYEIDVVVDPGVTGFFDESFNEILSSSTPGTITVTGNVTAVPEPSSAVLLVLACACGLFGCRTLRHRFFVSSVYTPHGHD